MFYSVVVRDRVQVKRPSIAREALRVIEENDEGLSTTHAEEVGTTKFILPLCFVLVVKVVLVSRNRLRQASHRKGAEL